MMIKILILILAMLFIGPVQAGQYPATISRVVDGDTFDVDVIVWPDISVSTRVRVRGVDTPEIRGKCQAEKDLAIQATARTSDLIGGHVILENIAKDSFGRSLATVILNDGRDLADVLKSEGLGREWHKGKRNDWC